MKRLIAFFIIIFSGFNLILASQIADDLQYAQKLLQNNSDTLKINLGSKKTLSLQFIEGIKSDSGSSNLGLSFNYDHVIKQQAIGNITSPLNLSCKFSAEGIIPLRKSNLVNDFSSGNIDIGISQFIFSAKPAAALKRIPPDIRDAYVFKAAACSTDTQKDELEQTPEAKLFCNAFTRVLKENQNSLLWEFSGHAAIETNRDFPTNRQMVYGLQISTCGSLGDNKRWLNIVDYPAALVRWILDENAQFNPDGLAIPSAIISMDWIDPAKNTDRMAIDSSKDFYPRMRCEVAYKTNLLQNGKNIIDLALSYRFYQEISASKAIKEAELSQSNYVAVRIGMSNGMIATYSYGRLPFDIENTNNFGIGWNIQFK